MNSTGFVEKFHLCFCGLYLGFHCSVDELGIFSTNMWKTEFHRIYGNYFSNGIRSFRSR